MNWRVAAVRGIASIVVVVALTRFVTNNPGGQGSFKLSVKDQSVTYELKSPKLEFLELFDAMFKEPKIATVTMALLREQRRYFQIDDIMLVDALEQLAYDHKVSRRLRALELAGKGPFEKRERKVRVSFPPGTSIAVGHAAVCHNSEWRGSRLIIRPLARGHGRMVSVLASAFFHCDDALTQDERLGPLVQITRNDAKQLYGNRALGAKEDGMAYAMPPEPVPIELPQAATLPGGGA